MKMTWHKNEDELTQKNKDDQYKNEGITRNEDNQTQKRRQAQIKNEGNVIWIHEHIKNTKLGLKKEDPCNAWEVLCHPSGPAHITCCGIISKYLLVEEQLYKLVCLS